MEVSLDILAEALELKIEETVDKDKLKLVYEFLDKGEYEFSLSDIAESYEKAIIIKTYEMKSDFYYSNCGVYFNWREDSILIVPL